MAGALACQADLPPALAVQHDASLHRPVKVETTMGSALLFLFNSIISLIILVVIVNALLSWLIAFEVLNVRNPTVYRIVRALDAITDPLLRPIRRFIPSLGGMDLSPIVLILLLQALKILVMNTLAGPLISTLG
jgi:YggT family protein